MKKEWIKSIPKQMKAEDVINFFFLQLVMDNSIISGFFCPTAQKYYKMYRQRQHGSRTTDSVAADLPRNIDLLFP